MKIKTAVIGLGYWGPNYVRNFIRNGQSQVLWVCDLSDESLKKTSQAYPYLKLTKDYKEILTNDEIDLVAIATPPQTHYKIAKDCLLAKKHVFIAKPLATKLTDAKELLKIARENNLLLHCDLTYLYTGAVKEIKDLLCGKRIGEPLYYDSTRSNLGLIQNDVSVVWDLVPHDLAILSSCFNLEPLKVFCTGSRHHSKKMKEEMAHITIQYSNNFIAHIHVSWISPVKLRTILIGGTKKMIFYNDVEPDEKIRIYDKSVNISESITTTKPIYRSGNIIIPKLDNEEALFLEINELISRLLKKKINYENPQMNIKIINILEKCDKSLLSGKTIILKR